MSSRIPTLDIRRFDTDREAFVAELGAAYREWGFCGVSGHGITGERVEGPYRAFRDFFALPVATKMQYHVPGNAGARGYTPFGIETAKGAKYHDLKEFWHVGRELPAGSRYSREMAPNIWVDSIPGFRESTLSLYESFDALGRRLLSPIASNLGLASNYFDDKVNLGNSVLRVIHYPPMPPEPTPSARAVVLRSSAHSSRSRPGGRDGRRTQTRRRSARTETARAHRLPPRAA